MIRMLSLAALFLSGCLILSACAPDKFPASGAPESTIKATAPVGAAFAPLDETSGIEIIQLPMTGIPWGGRAVAVSLRPGVPETALVASETGGLFQTTDNGWHWQRVNSLPMFRLSDVRYIPGTRPGHPEDVIVVVVGPPDSHTDNQGTIQISYNGGATWATRHTYRPSCFSAITGNKISYVPFSGTIFYTNDCGISYSTNWGESWNHISLGGRYWGVAANPSGNVAVCNEQGVRYAAVGTSPPYGDIYTQGCNSPHALAFSPLEDNVLYMGGYGPLPSTCPDDTRTVAVHEGINVSGVWTWRRVTPQICVWGGREPWVAVTPSRDIHADHYDVYFGDANALWRKTCTRGNSSSTDARCDTTGWTVLPGGHDDRNGMDFNPSNHCPKYVVSDGGIHSPAYYSEPQQCGHQWQMSGTVANGYNALQIYDVGGTNMPDHVDLYIGTQDNGVWSSQDGGQTWPTAGRVEGHTPQSRLEASVHNEVYMTYRDASNQSNELVLPHLTPLEGLVWQNPLGRWNHFPPILARDEMFIQWNEPTTATYRLSMTPNHSISWSPVVTRTVGVIERAQVSIPDDRVIVFTPYQRAGSLYDLYFNLGLLKIAGIYTYGYVSGPSITYADRPGPAGVPGQVNLGPFSNEIHSFTTPAIFGVDSRNPNNLMAADIYARQMKITSTGGVTWTVVSNLTALVVGSVPDEHVFSYVASSHRWGHPIPGADTQVHVITYNPFVRNHILVGTEAQGIFQSSNGGLDWEAIPGTQQITAISSFFFQRPRMDGKQTVFVSTYGRGLWKVTAPRRLRSYRLSDSMADGWNAANVLRNPHDGTPINFDALMPSTCPRCLFVAVPRRIILGLQADDSGVVNMVFLDGGHLIGSTVEGEPFKVDIPSRIVDKSGEFQTCEACQEIIEGGGVIHGFVTVDGQLTAVMVSTGELPEAESILRFDAFLPLEEEFFGDPVPELVEGPYLTLSGSQGFAGGAAIESGEQVIIRGTGFSNDPACEKLQIKLDGNVLLDGILPDKLGAFEARPQVVHHYGTYLLQAYQVCPDQEYETYAWLMIVIGESWAREHLLFLPLLRR